MIACEAVGTAVKYILGCFAGKFPVVTCPCDISGDRSGIEPDFSKSRYGRGC